MLGPVLSRLEGLPGQWRPADRQDQAEPPEACAGERAPLPQDRSRPQGNRAAVRRSVPGGSRRNAGAHHPRSRPHRRSDRRSPKRARFFHGNDDLPDEKLHDSVGIPPLESAVCAIPSNPGALKTWKCRPGQISERNPVGHHVPLLERTHLRVIEFTLNLCLI